MKKLLFALICWASSSLGADGSIEGFWKSISEKTGKAECVVAIYQYKGDNFFYGRMIGSFDDNGKMDDTIYNPKKRATALPGQPFYCGMDFIWALYSRGSVYKGKILDPEHGDVYKAEVWAENGNLEVRGKLMFFGRTETWVPATMSDYPPDFKLPDVTQFVPVAPVDELLPWPN